MRERILRGTRQYEVESEYLLELKYYIIKKSINQFESYYGIEINSNKIRQGMGDAQKYNFLFLSESKEWVEQIIDQFIGNGVTPDTMEYIIDDIIEIPC